VEAYDTLTTGRFDQPALAPSEALARITACRHWWSERVFAAFEQTIVAARVSGDTPPTR
jgi:HD-GYP domain-containing protein (c-di-GMP phosphodiesterase class II)